MDKALHRAKRRQLIKTTVISIITAVIVAVLGIWGISRLTMRQSGHLYAELENYHTLKEPNIARASELLNNNTLIGGTIVTQEYKDLDGYIVKWQRLTSGYTSLRHTLDQTLTATGSIINAHGQASTGSTQAFNADSGHKVALFYTATHKLPNEAAELPAGEVAEVALTFKRSYTYAELRKLLPQNVNLTWGYVFSEPFSNDAPIPHMADPVGISFDGGISLKYW